jgi:hypothetical protein
MEACMEFLKHENWNTSTALSALEASPKALVDLHVNFQLKT